MSSPRHHARSPPLERQPRGVVAAHPVHADAGRRRRRTEIDTLERRRIGAPRRPREELAEIAHARRRCRRRRRLALRASRSRRRHHRRAPARTRGSPARSARSALDARQHVDRRSAAARGSTPTRCACRLARASDRTRVGWLSSTKGRSAALPVPRVALRRGDLRRACRRGAPCRPPRTPASRPRDRRRSSAQSTLNAPMPYR